MTMVMTDDARDIHGWVEVLLQGGAPSQLSEGGCPGLELQLNSQEGIWMYPEGCTRPHVPTNVTNHEWMYVFLYGTHDA